MEEPKKLLDNLLARYEDAKTRKSQYDSTLTEVGKYVWPPMQDMIRTVTVENEGQVRTVDIYDSTANLAAYRMTSGIFSYLMPVGTKWFEFTAKDNQLNNDPVVQAWLSKATAAVHKEIWRSNFQREMFITIRSSCVFGTSCISVERYGSDIIFRTYHIGNLFFEENAKGYIDTVFRRIFYTARQARQEWPDVNLGKSVEAELKKEQPSSERFEFLHCVYPNSDYNKEKVGSKKYKSLFINIKDRHIIKESGYDGMPYLVARFSKTPDEIMGRSPATELLPEIKMLNAMKRTFIEAAEKEANPPLVFEDDGVVGQPVTSANGAIIVRAGAKYPEALRTGSNAQLNAEIIAQQQQLIREGFFNDLFDALANYRNMTATEVVQRVEEKMVLLAPAISALQKELFDPLITRVLDLLPESALEKPPFEFDKNIVYQGRLALAMSNMQTNAIESTLAKWQPYLELAPDLFDNIKLDDAFRTSALNAGVPAEMLTDEEFRTQIRSERNARNQAAMDAQVMADASKAYKNVAVAPQPGSMAAML